MEGIVEFLINDQSFDVNATDYRGRTPLHYAVESGHLDIVQLLVENNANLNAEDERGKKPLDLSYAQPQMNEFLATGILSQKTILNFVAMNIPVISAIL